MQADQEASVLAEEQVQRLAEESRLRAEEEARRRAEAEARLHEEQGRMRADQEGRAKAEEEARRRREEAEARLAEAEVRLQVEHEAAARAEEEARRLAEETRLKAEEEARRRAEAEAHLREEEARLQAELEARVRAEEEAQQLAKESRLKAEEEARRRREEAEARLAEAAARLQADHEASAQAEEETQRLAEESRLRAEEESLRGAEAGARLKEEEARLQNAQEARARAEVEALRLVKESERVEAEARRRAEAEARLKAEQARLLSNEEDLSESLGETFQIEAVTPAYSSPELSWVESSLDLHDDLLPVEEETGSADESPFVAAPLQEESAKGIDRVFAEKGIVSAEDDGGIPSDVLKRLSSPEASEREAALAEVVRVGGDDAFRCISRAFDDQSADVRNAAAQALFDLESDRAATFTRALREGTPERRRKIGQALAGSGLAREAVGNLTGESREKTYDAFSLLFLMAKAGEVQPLMQAIEDYPNVEVRIAVVKLLALSGQSEIVPAFRRLAVRGSLPSEVRSAVMEAIYQISSQARESAPSAA